MSLCKQCRYRLDTWAESLRDTWDGCGKGLEFEGDINKFIDGIQCSDVALGWITNGKMAFNEQVLTQKVKKCEYFSQKMEV